MSGLLLVGASGLAAEVIAVLRREPVGPIGVLDDDARRWGTDLGPVPVLGGLDLVREHPERRLVVCVGRGPARRAVVARLRAMGVGSRRFATVLGRVDNPDGCPVGEGSVLLDGVVITARARIGRHVVAMPHVTVTHDDVVGDFATLCAGVALGGDVRVGEGAYLGMNASVREGVCVGRDTVLGMGAALVRDLPDDETWTGVPARPVRAAAEAGR